MNTIKLPAIYLTFVGSAIMVMFGCAQFKAISFGGVAGIAGVEYLKEKEAGIIDKVCSKSVIDNRNGREICVEWHDRRAQFGVMMGANTALDIFLIFVNPAIGGAYMGAGALWGLINTEKMGLEKIEQRQNWTPEDYLKNCGNCSDSFYHQ